MKPFSWISAARPALRVPSQALHDREQQPGLLVERFDRISRGRGQPPLRLHQEDGCQLLDRYPTDKYNLSCSDIGGAIHETCTAPLVETAKFIRLIAFSYLIGNGDLHAKKHSVRTLPSGLTELIPAYDVLSTLPYGDKKMALSLDGRVDNLKCATLVRFGERFGVRPAATAGILDELCMKVAAALPRFAGIGFDARQVAYLGAVTRMRLRDLRLMTRPAAVSALFARLRNLPRAQPGWSASSNTRRSRDGFRCASRAQRKPYT